MRSRLLQLRLWLENNGLISRGRLAFIAWYLLGLDVLLFVVQKLANLFHERFGNYLGVWIAFLSLVVIGLFFAIAIRRLSSRLLWRLRNRLIVTYIFIGVIPIVLLLTMFVISGYLLGNQLTTLLVHRDLMAEVQNLDTLTSTVAQEIASQLERKSPRSLQLSAL